MQEAAKAAIPADRITLLTPGSVDHLEKEMQSVPTDTAEQPGMGKAIGALSAAGWGLREVRLLIALVPGVGPITALGLLGAAIVGAAGAAVGAAVGDRAEKSTTEGLPEDEIYVYEDALRGRAQCSGCAGRECRFGVAPAGNDEDERERSRWTRPANSGGSGCAAPRRAIIRNPARTLPMTREFYRLGFQAALHAKTRCMEFDQVSGEMNAALEDVQREHPGADVEEAFTRGYQRGRDYYQQLCDRGQKGCLERAAMA